MAMLRRSAFALIIMLGLVPQAAPAQETGILVNGQPLTAQEFWGVEGGPYAGQVLAGLPLGGPLQPDASDGNTGVFINNREIHMREYLELLQIFGEVPPGRYWLDANLIGGLEGQPPSFNLNAAEAPASGGTGGGKRYFEDEVGDFCARYGGC